MEKVITEFKDSLIIDSADIIGDYVEIGIDSAIESEILKEIPIIKTGISVFKITKSVRERIMIKNLCVFISELNSGNIEKDKLEEYIESLDNNPKKAEEELGRVLIILDQMVDNKKVLILSKIFKSYINQEIDWNLFVEFSEITNRIYVNDIDTLNLIYTNQINDTSNRDDVYRIERLNSLGIVGLTTKAIFMGPGNNRTDSLVTLNNIGRKYANIIFR